MSCNKCIRCIIFLCNFVFFITGCSLIGTGAYLRIEKDDYWVLCDKYSWATGANILLAVGVIILFVALFGCYEAWKRTTRLLKIFVFFLMVIFVLELGAGIYAATEKSKFVDELKECLDETFTENINNKGKARDHWHKFEKEFECCGLNGDKDYIGVTPVPDCLEETYFDKGCYDKIKDELQDNLVTVMGVGGGFAVIQILGIVMSLWMICKMKDAVKSPLMT